MATRRANPDKSHPPSERAAKELTHTFKLAKRVTDVTGCPVVGGIAVALHGWPRFTGDIDLYSADFWSTHQSLEAAGALWNSERREHIIDGVAVHMVSDDELGGPPRKTSIINGIRVISLADLIRSKLTSGLNDARRSKDLLDVIELIRIIPLKKDFAGRLPMKLRKPFKQFVDEVHGPRRTRIPSLKFWKATAS